MKFPRVTIGRLMIVVPLMGILLAWAADHEIRRHQFTQLRLRHQSQLFQTFEDGRRIVDGQEVQNHPAFSEELKSKREHHIRLIERYEWYARNP